MSRIFQAGVLRAQCAAILEAAGSSAAEATQVADNLVLANLSGHDSHGVGMLPRYVDAVAEGGLVPGASVAVTLDIGGVYAGSVSAVMNTFGNLGAAEITALIADMAEQFLHEADKKREAALK